MNLGCPYLNINVSYNTNLMSEKILVQLVYKDTVHTRKVQLHSLSFVQRVPRHTESRKLTPPERRLNNVGNSQSVSFLSIIRGVWNIYKVSILSLSPDTQRLLTVCVKDSQVT